MPTKTAIKSAVQGAILAGTALFLFLPACVVAESVTIVSPGARTDDLADPFAPGSLGGGSYKRATATPTKGTPKPSKSPSPTPGPTAAPIDLAADGWIELNSGVSVDLHGVVAIPPTTGKAQLWAVGDGGTIVRSTDGGDTWTQQDSGTTKNLYAIAYDISPGYLLAGGEDGTLLLTSSNGASWSALPVVVATGSNDPAGTIRQVDLRTVGNKGRREVWFSSDRYPLLGAVNLWKPFEDPADLPLPWRDPLVWGFGPTSAETPTRFSFHDVLSDRAYGIAVVHDKANVDVCGTPVCIGFPDMSKTNAQVPWSWRPTPKFDGKTTPDGLPTDISTVRDVDFECSDRSSTLPAYLATDKAVYRTADYGRTWKKILSSGASRVIALGRGKLVVVSPTKIWHGTAQYPGAICPKGEPSFLWQQVDLQPGDLDVDPVDQFLTAVRSSDTTSKPPDMWIAGRKGRIIYRKSQ